jgi:2',3'-cyclic-nucleotide 2'-phosphodiesterase (5'-nucleotidase family)
VDVVISGHTHQAYNCVIDDMLVTSAASFGRIVTDVDLTIDRKTGDVIAVGRQRIVTRTVPKGPADLALIGATTRWRPRWPTASSARSPPTSLAVQRGGRVGAG